MEWFEKLFFGAIALALVIASCGLVFAIYQKTKEEPIVPKFEANQCFAKGLREPWDADVAGIVIRKGYSKYLVMYASEARRDSLGAKTGWEEDIRTFDSKYTLVPCPDKWLTHKR